jgi:hypothetical protein
MEAWGQAFPRDITDEHAFFAQKKAEHWLRRRAYGWCKAFIHA